MWLSPLVMEYVCHFNVRYFPYDTQYCSLTMGSWIYHGQEVDVFNKNDEGNTRSFQQIIPLSSFTITHIALLVTTLFLPFKTVVASF